MAIIVKTSGYSYLHTPNDRSTESLLRQLATIHGQTVRGNLKIDSLVVWGDVLHVIPTAFEILVSAKVDRLYPFTFKVPSNLIEWNSVKLSNHSSPLDMLEMFGATSNAIKDSVLVVVDPDLLDNKQIREIGKMVNLKEQNTIVIVRSTSDNSEWIKHFPLANVIVYASDSISPLLTSEVESLLLNMSKPITIVGDGDRFLTSVIAACDVILAMFYAGTNCSLQEKISLCNSNVGFISKFYSNSHYNLSLEEHVLNLLRHFGFDTSILVADGFENVPVFKVKPLLVPVS